MSFKKFAGAGELKMDFGFRVTGWKLRVASRRERLLQYRVRHGVWDPLSHVYLPRLNDIATQNETKQERVLHRFVRLLADPRFRQLDCAIVIQHVPALKDLTWRELKAAVDQNKAEVRPDIYVPPNLCRVLPYLLQKARKKGEQIDVDKEYLFEPPSEKRGSVEFHNLHELLEQYKHCDITTLLIAAAAGGDASRVEKLLQQPGAEVDKGDYDFRTPLHLASSNGHADIVMLLIEKGANVNVEDRWGGRPLDDAIKNNNATAEILRHHGAVVGGQQVHKVDEDSSNKPGLWRSPNTRDLAGVKDQSIEIRQIYIETLRRAYAYQVKRGELDGRGLLDKILLSSLDQASAKVSRGKPLDDWKILSRSTPWSVYAEKVVNDLHAFGTRQRRRQSVSMSMRNRNFGAGLQFRIKVSLAYISAHTLADHLFQTEFASSSTYGEFTAAKARVLEESKDGVKRAKEFLESQDPVTVSCIVSQMACVILLNTAARYMEYLAKAGLLKQKEATHYIEECEHALVGLQQDAINAQQQESTGKGEGQVFSA